MLTKDHTREKGRSKTSAAKIRKELKTLFGCEVCLKI